MAILSIYSCFHPVLRKKTEPITEINDEIVKLSKDMFETMYNAEGAGLAGNQVGVSKSIVVVDLSYYNENNKKYKPLLMINPEILSVSDETSEFQEGCLSVPQVNENVIRPKAIQFRYYDLDAKEYVVEDDDLLARVVQHEIDHLNGKLFYERISPLRRAMIKSKLKKIEKSEILPAYPFINHKGEKVV